MKVAVITPYYKEAEAVLDHCHRSVRDQTYPCVHYMVADGHPSDAVASWDTEHIRLPRAHADNGNTPRAIGSLSAINQGFDAIAYLDADNWFRDDHIATLVSLHQQTGADVCTSGRSFHRLDGSQLQIVEPCDGITHVDTSCMLLTRSAFGVIPLWGLMPKFLSPLCDRIFWQGVLKGGYSHAHSGLPTMAFRTQYAFHYLQSREPPPAGAKAGVFKGPAAAWNALTVEERRVYCKRMGFSLSSIRHQWGEIHLS